MHNILKEIVRKSIGEAEDLKRFPTLQAELAATSFEALERFCEDSKKTTLLLVDMESAYLTVEFFMKLPKSVVHCQVRESKRSLLNLFYKQIGKKGKDLGKLLDEDPALMEQRQQMSKRLELYKAARQEIESVSWSK